MEVKLTLPTHETLRVVKCVDGKITDCGTFEVAAGKTWAENWDEILDSTNPESSPQADAPSKEPV